MSKRYLKIVFNKQIVARKIEEKYILLDAKNNKVYLLNEAATILVDIFKTPRALEEVVNYLTKAGMNQKNAMNMIENFVSDINSLGLLEDSFKRENVIPEFKVKVNCLLHKKPEIEVEEMFEEAVLASGCDKGDIDCAFSVPQTS